MDSSDTLPVTAAQPIIGGNAPRRAADDDVLRRQTLEPDRVDDGVKEDREGQKPRRDPVRRKTQHRHRDDRQSDADRQRLARLDTARGHGTTARALHDEVDIGVVPHVEGTRRARAQRDEEDRGEADHRRHPSRRHEEAHERREHDQRHHTRLEKLHVIAELCLRRAGRCVGRCVSHLFALHIVGRDVSHHNGKGGTSPAPRIIPRPRIRGSRARAYRRSRRIPAPRRPARPRIPRASRRRR